MKRGGRFVGRLAFCVRRSARHSVARTRESSEREGGSDSIEEGAASSSACGCADRAASSKIAYLCAACCVLCERRAWWRRGEWAPSPPSAASAALRRCSLEPTSSSSRRERSQSQTRSDTSGGRQPTAEVSAPRINERKHSRRDPMSEPSAPRRRCRLEGGLEDEDKRRADGRETNRRAHPYNAGEHEYKQESASSAHTPPSRTALPFAANCGRRASNSSSQPRSFPRCVELFLPLP